MCVNVCMCVHLFVIKLDPVRGCAHTINTIIIIIILIIIAIIIIVHVYLCVCKCACVCDDTMHVCALVHVYVCMCVYVSTPSDHDERDGGMWVDSRNPPMVVCMCVCEHKCLCMNTQEYIRTHIDELAYKMRTTHTHDE